MKYINKLYKIRDITKQVKINNKINQIYKNWFIFVNYIKKKLGQFLKIYYLIN